MVDILILAQQSPKISVIIIAVAISFFISLINYFFLDKERMKEIRTKQKNIQKQIKEHQKAGNHEKMMALQKEMLADMPEMMKHSMKPMLITLIDFNFILLGKRFFCGNRNRLKLVLVVSHFRISLKFNI